MHKGTSPTAGMAGVEPPVFSLPGKWSISVLHHWLLVLIGYKEVIEREHGGKRPVFNQLWLVKMTREQANKVFFRARRGNKPPYPAEYEVSLFYTTSTNVQPQTSVREEEERTSDCCCTVWLWGTSSKSVFNHYRNEVTLTYTIKAVDLPRHCLRRCYWGPGNRTQ